ncbi:Uncharacterised protein [Nocardia africana]|uniref:DUF2637 domain-containing protein n=1 Tax=Nocardia africana TaxID=134964 RepID=A0A379X4T3_9NOCA|nr:Uncharacterised protein [Nocardia africana]
MLRTKPNILRSAAAPVSVEQLQQQVDAARGMLPLQTDPALREALSPKELAAERRLAEWTRRKRRRQERRAVSAELTTQKRNRRAADAIARADHADQRWHRKALAARQRVVSADANLATLFRRSEWSSRALISVVVLGMLWAGVNVQHNLVPDGDMTNPLYWLSYGFEAMISIPIIVIMVVATTAARQGREIERGRVLFFELALLSATIGLNAGPRLFAGDPGKAAEFAVAPIMVGSIIWLHAWVANRYSVLIDEALAHAPALGHTDSHELAPDHEHHDGNATLALENTQTRTASAAPADADADAKTTPAPCEDRPAPAAEDGRTIAAAGIACASANTDADTAPNQLHAHSGSADPARIVPDPDHAVMEFGPTDLATAEAMATRELTTLPVEQIAAILALASDNWTPAAIGQRVGLFGSQVLAVLEAHRTMARTAESLPAPSSAERAEMRAAPGSAAAGAGVTGPSDDAGPTTILTPTAAASDPAPTAQEARTATAPSASTDPHHAGAADGDADAAQRHDDQVRASFAPRITSANQADLGANATAGSGAVVRALPVPRTDEGPDQFTTLAERIVERGLVTRKSPELIATVLRMLDEGCSHNEINKATATPTSGGVHHKTIKTIAAAAETVRVPVRVVR